MLHDFKVLYIREGKAREFLCSMNILFLGAIREAMAKLPLASLDNDVFIDTGDSGKLAGCCITAFF